MKDLRLLRRTHYSRFILFLKSSAREYFHIVLIASSVGHHSPLMATISLPVVTATSFRSTTPSKEDNPIVLSAVTPKSYSHGIQRGISWHILMSQIRGNLWIGERSIMCIYSINDLFGFWSLLHMSLISEVIIEILIILIDKLYG